jgi:hypothetical protein
MKPVTISCAFMAAIKSQYPPVVTAGIVTASLLCLWGALEHYQAEAAYQAQFRDPYMISAQFTRFEPLLAAVPAGTELGYLTDAAPGSVADPSMLLSAQYVLAPRLVAKGSAHEWVVGNFTRPGDFAGVGRSNGLRLVQDFGNGVVLFRKEH